VADHGLALDDVEPSARHDHFGHPFGLERSDQRPIRDAKREPWLPIADLGAP
jgi:hypothetical protein